MTTPLSPERKVTLHLMKGIKNVPPGPKAISTSYKVRIPLLEQSAMSEASLRRSTRRVKKRPDYAVGDVVEVSRETWSFFGSRCDGRLIS
jgi:hypothetical protein